MRPGPTQGGLGWQPWSSGPKRAPGPHLETGREGRPSSRRAPEAPAPRHPPRGGLRPPPAPHWHRAVLSQQLFPSPVTIFTHLEGLVLISVIFPLTTQPN